LPFSFNLPPILFLLSSSPIFYFSNAFPLPSPTQTTWVNNPLPTQELNIRRPGIWVGVNIWELNIKRPGIWVGVNIWELNIRRPGIWVGVNIW
jgi:hypothetical protein